MTGPKVKVFLQSSSDTSDSAGGFTKTWTTVREIRGILVARKASERFYQGSSKVFSTHLFMTRKPIDISITEEYRIVYNSETYEITFVNNAASKNIFLILELRKVV